MDIFTKLYVVGAAVSSVIIAGRIFAEMNGMYPELAQRDRGIDMGCGLIAGIVGGLGWPLSLPIVLALTDRGWRLWPKRYSDVRPGEM